MNERDVAKQKDWVRGRQPKRLTFDLETSFSIGYYFPNKGLYEVNIIKEVRHSYVLSIAWKWEHEKTVHVLKLPDFPLYKKDPHTDRQLMEKIAELLNEADVVIGQNSDKFDVKVINARLLKHGIAIPSPYIQIDTLKIARKYVKLPSYSLDNLAEYFGIGSKKKTGGFELWEGCDRGDMASWKKMADYNKHDVFLTDAVYKRLRPLHATHPNMNLFLRQPMSCRVCLSQNMRPMHKRFVVGGWKQRYLCECGAYNTGTETFRNVEKVGIV